MPRLLSVVLLALLTSAAFAQTTRPAPIPSAQEQSRARAMIRGIYKDGLTKTAQPDRRALAKEWLKQAADTRDDSAAAYILLMDGADLAANAGDATTALAAATALQSRFDIGVQKSLEHRKQLLLKTNAALNAGGIPVDFEALSRLALQSAGLAAVNDDFALVSELSNLAEGAANKTLQVKTVSAIQPELARLRTLAADYEKLKPALARLAANPDATDDAAQNDHLALGKFYALELADWARGLQHLAKSSDLKLNTLAFKELALTSSAVDTSEPADRLVLSLADEWWDLAQSFTGIQRQNATLHAQALYKQAQSMVQGITLARIQSRLSAQPDDSANPSAVASMGVNLLPLVNTSKDAVQGSWHIADDGLTCDSSTYATVQLPFAPPDEYDVVATFTRTEGSGPIAFLLTAHGKAFGYSLDTRGESRFERINGKVSQDNPTVTATALSNNHRYTLTIQVRKEALRASLDGKLLSEYHPDPTFKDLSRYPSWKLADPALLGLGAHNARVAFHSIRLVEITGKGRPTR
jgi:hypothetical protein